MNKANKQRAMLLGMPFGTANAKLRKMILFKLVKESGQDICYRCGKEIKTIEELSIEHKQSWPQGDNPKQLFFDLDNIAFSHLKCNCGAGPRRISKKQVSKDGTLDCNICKKILPKENFGKTKKVTKDSRGYRYECNDCRKLSG